MLNSCGDGKHIYCADVIIENVSNPQTYTLSVELYEGSIYKIYFPNGGYLDQSHFNKDDAKIIYDDYGESASFTDDRDRNITVYLNKNNNKPCSDDEDYLFND